MNSQIVKKREFDLDFLLLESYAPIHEFPF